MTFRKAVVITVLVSVFSVQAQASKRKTRSDKGGHHKHSPAYYLKHGFSGHSQSNQHSYASAHSAAVMPTSATTTTEDSLRLSGFVAERTEQENAGSRGLANVAIILAIILSVSVIGYIVTQRKQKQKQERARQARVEELKRKKEALLLKYSAEEVSKLLKHEYWIGMTEEQLIDAKGKPDKIEVEQMKTKTKRIYVYGNKSSGDVFSFVNGTLERFKDR